MKTTSACQMLLAENQENMSAYQNGPGTFGSGLADMNWNDALPEALKPPFLYRRENGEEDPLGLRHIQVSADDVWEMQELRERTRMQIRFIVSALRRWKIRHRNLGNQRRRRFSTIEGLMLIHDLKRHWVFYRLM